MRGCERYILGFNRKFGEVEATLEMDYGTFMVVLIHFHSLFNKNLEFMSRFMVKDGKIKRT